MNYVKLFLEFLAKSRCLGRYFYNFEKQAKSVYGSEYAGAINSLLSDDPKDYIYAAFRFSATKEGADYWFELNDDWCAYLKINADNER